jgi:hypothetical protein
MLSVTRKKMPEFDERAECLEEGEVGKEGPVGKE